MSVLQSNEESVVSQVTVWESVTAGERRGERTGLSLGGEDYGYVDDGSLDLPLSIFVREALAAAGRIERPAVK